MRNARFLSRFLALLLALSFALPSPALALRTEQIVSAGTEERLAQALGYSAAGAEEQWQDQMWEILAEGFDIPVEELKRRLQPSDLLDFRRSVDQEALGPKLDIYARMLLGMGLTVVSRRRMMERLGPLIEPPLVYPESVVTAYTALSDAKTKEEFDTRLELFLAAIQSELPRLSSEDPARKVLERFLKTGDFTPEQKEILRTVARRVVAAFLPELQQRGIGEVADSLLSVTYPPTFEVIRPTLWNRILWLREKFKTEKDWVGASIDNLMPWGEHIPPAQVLVPLLGPQEDAVFAGVAAHEYGHLVLWMWENLTEDRQGRWHGETEWGEQFADWITQGLSRVMEGWFSLDRGEAIQVTKTLTIWFDQRAKQLVGEPTEAWVQDWGLLESLPPQLGRYVQGNMAGAIAEVLGRKIASQRPGANPYQIAAEFLAWYAKRPMKQSIPRVEEMAQAAQIFLAHQGTSSSAGVEEKEFPRSVPQDHHPWNIAHAASEGVSPSVPLSYMDRYPSQGEFVVKEMLPELVARKIQERNKQLTFFVGGVATGEEALTLAARIAEAFKANPFWGPVEGWAITIYGVDREGEILQEAGRRIRGDSPVASPPTPFIQQVDDSRIQQIMQTLQENRTLARKWINLIHANLFDLRKTALRKARESSDAIFLNAVGGEVFKSPKSNRWIARLSRLSQHAYVVFSSSDTSPRRDKRLRISADRMKRLPYDIVQERYASPSFVVKLAAGAEEKEFPAPVASELHPWNVSTRKFPVYSYLDRYPSQEEFVAETLLSELVDQKLPMGKREITFFVPAVATGEEVFTLAAMIVEAFSKHSEWGSLADWKITLYGSDIDQQALDEATRRISGQSPMVFLSNHVDLGRHQDRVNQIKGILQREHLLVRQWIKLFWADYLKPENPEFREALRQADAIFLNAVSSNLSPGEKKNSQLVQVLKDKADEAYLIFSGNSNAHNRLFEIAPERRRKLPYEQLREVFAAPSHVISPPAAGAEERAMVEVDGQVVTLPAGGMLFDGLTRMKPDGSVLLEPDGSVKLATELLPASLILKGLDSGRPRLVLPVPQVGYAGKIYVEQGIQLHPSVTAALGADRIRVLPAQLQDWKVFLHAEEVEQPLVVMDDPSEAQRAFLPDSALVLNMPKDLASQLLVSQWMALETALRQYGSLPRLKGLIERDWKGELDVFDLAA